MNIPSIFDEAAIESVLAGGTAFLREALPGDQLQALRTDVDRIAWTPQSNTVADTTWLHYDDAKISPRDDFPAINALRTQLEYTIWRLGDHWRQLCDWRANDVTAQRYGDAGDGIAAHQDYCIDRLLIAVFTVRGEGAFEVLRSRHDPEVVARYCTRPGSLCLLWAPDLEVGVGDRRPTHRILEATAGRVSLTYRYAVGKFGFQGESPRVGQS